MPVDKFGRMSDLKTKDTGVSLTYINNNYVRSDGETPLTGSLNMRGNTLYNVADPVNPQDVVTKVYVDNTKGSGVIGRKTGNGVSIKENLDFLGKQKIKNLPDPIDNKDAVTKEYVDTTTAPFLKLDQTKYNTKGDIDMGGFNTVLNVKTPIDDNHIVDKKYVDEMDNLKSAFAFRNGEYYAKGNIYLRKNKLGGLQEPTNDGEAATKKYVDDLITNHFVDENDNIAFGRDVDMEGNQIIGLSEPTADHEPATKKYVDDLQTYQLDRRGNVKFDRNINLDRNRIFSMKEPTKPSEGANKKYVDDTINKRLQEEKDNFLPQDPATKEYVDEAIKGLAGGDILVSKEGVFIKANGHYRATAPLDIDNHKMENLPDPVDEKDAVNKKYIDGIVEDLTLKQGLIRENGGFNLVDSYINMNFHNVRNLGFPKDESDAVPRRFVDSMIKEVEEKINKKKQLITVNTSYCGPLEEGEYPFKFGGNNIKNCTEEITRIVRFHRGLPFGFVMPHSGRIKKIICECLTYLDFNKDFDNLDKVLNKEQINELENYYGKWNFKEELLNDIKKVNFSTYRDIKKGDPLPKGKTFFKIEKIVKIAKNVFNGYESSLDNFIDGEIKYYDVVEEFENEEFTKSKYWNRIDTFTRFTNHDTIPLKEGDTINIYVSDLFSGNILRDILTKDVIRLFGILNFNFTFLIELDPL